MKIKKKIIIILSVIAVVLVSALAILISNNIKKERELQEAIKLIEQQEKEAQELKEQQEQEEKERQEQERLAKLEEGWNALGENQQYLTPNTEHFNVTYNNDNTWKFTYSAEFVRTLLLIENGWFSSASMEDINRIINIAIPLLPENPTGKDLFGKFVEIAQTKDRDTIITGEGESPYDYFSSWGDDTTDTTQSQQTTNNNNQSNTNNNNSSNSNKNNNSNSNSSSDNSDAGISEEEAGAANGWDVNTNPDPGDVEIDEDLADDFLEGLENFNGGN